MRNKRCCIAGYAPQALKRPEDDVRVDLENCILSAIGEGYTTFISGLDRGVGIWAAEIVVRLKDGGTGLHLVAAVPWPGFDEEWEDGWRQRYRVLLSRAEYVKVLCPAEGRDALMKRSEWMVSHSARLIAVYNGESGEIRDTVRCARVRRVPVRYVKG